jgi:hypothetical protein
LGYRDSAESFDVLIGVPRSFNVRFCVVWRMRVFALLFWSITVLLSLGSTVAIADVIDVAEIRLELSKHNTLTVVERFSFADIADAGAGAIPAQEKKSQGSKADHATQSPEFRRVFNSGSLQRKDGTDTSIDFKAVRRNGASVQFRLERKTQGLELVVSPRSLLLTNSNPVELEIEYSIERPVVLSASQDEVSFVLIPQVHGFAMRHISGKLILPTSVPLSSVVTDFLSGESGGQIASEMQRAVGKTQQWQVDTFSGPIVEYRSRDGVFDSAQQLPAMLGVSFATGSIEKPKSLLARYVSVPALNASSFNGQIGYWFLVTSILGQIVFYVFMIRRRKYGHGKVTSSELKSWSAEEVATALGRNDKNILQAGLVHNLIKGKAFLVHNRTGASFLWSEQAREPGQLWKYAYHLVSGTRVLPQASQYAGEVVRLDQLHNALKSMAPHASLNALQRPSLLQSAERVRHSMDNTSAHSLAMLMAGVQIVLLILLRTTTTLADKLSALHTYGFYGATIGLLCLFFWILPRKFPYLNGVEAIIEFRQFLKGISFAFSSEVEAEEQTKRFEYFLPYAVAMGVHDLLCKSFRQSLAQCGASYYPHWYLEETSGESLDFFQEWDGFNRLVS